MYGIPRVIVVPGQGYGTYDWSDHTMLLPAFPLNNLPEKAAAYALGTFRWDSDEDRVIKNSYELIKENRGKSILDLSSSFYRDYFLWLTKEKKGYRFCREIPQGFRPDVLGQKPGITFTRTERFAMLTGSPSSPSEPS